MDDQAFWQALRRSARKSEPDFWRVIHRGIVAGLDDPNLSTETRRALLGAKRQIEEHQGIDAAPERTAREAQAAAGG